VADITTPTGWLVGRLVGADLMALWAFNAFKYYGENVGKHFALGKCNNVRKTWEEDRQEHGEKYVTQHVWSLGFLRCRCDAMELASTLTLGPCSEYWRLQIRAENSSFLRRKGTISALEARHDALYKSTTTTTNTLNPCNLIMILSSFMTLVQETRCAYSPTPESTRDNFNHSTFVTVFSQINWTIFQFTEQHNTQ